MAIGLMIRNDSGLIQIDGTYKNLAFKSKGTATMTSLASQVAYTQITVTGLGAFPVVACYSTLGAYAMVQSFSGGTAVINIAVVGGAIGTTVEYYIFDDPASAAANYFLVNNADGQMVFNGNQKYLKIAGSFSQGAYAGSNLFVGSSGKKYATFLSRVVARAVVYNNGNNGTSTQWFVSSLRGAPKNNGVNIDMVAAEMQITGPIVQATAPPGYDLSGTVFVADVTGY